VVCQSPSCAPKQYDQELPASGFELVILEFRGGRSTTRPYRSLTDYSLTSLMFLLQFKYNSIRLLLVLLFSLDFSGVQISDYCCMLFVIAKFVLLFRHLQFN